MSSMKLLIFVLAVSACTNGPSVAGQWKTSGAWGLGTCNQDFTWYDVVHVVVSNDSATLADEQHGCDDGGFDIAVPDGATNLNVAISTIAHQDSIHETPPVNYTVIGPVHGDYDLGTIRVP